MEGQPCRPSKQYLNKCGNITTSVTKSLYHTRAHPRILLKNLDSYILVTVNQNSALTFLWVETAVRALDFKSRSDCYCS